MAPVSEKPAEAMDYVAQPGGPLTGSLRVPGDKSISHRAVMLGALAEGETNISGLLQGEDVLATLAAFRAMGVQAEGPDNGRVRIHGAGLHGLTAPADVIDMGNSGTAMRLLAGILAGQPFDTVLTGDASLLKRPMSRVVDPLGAMGARIDSAVGGTPPLKIYGGVRLHGISYAMPVASAQVKSALLLAGMYAEGATSVTEPAPTRDHTERMLRGFGYPVESDGAQVRLRGGGTLRACNVDVPGDISSAAFFIVGAALTPGSDLVLEHVGVNPTRTGLLKILEMMGADIQIENKHEISGEPVADIHVRGSRLHGIRIPRELVPLAIDEFPVLFIAAARATGETELSGAEELRVKESDRIWVMARGLARLGIDAREKPDGMVIQGGKLRAGEIESGGDHRVAMAFAVAGQVAEGPVRIRDCRNVSTSFPGFPALARQAGLNLDTVEGKS